MTEAEWQTCADPKLMLEFLRGQVSGRKLRLFACACCRRVWDLLKDPRSRDAVAVAERYADGLARTDEVGDAATAADDVWMEAPPASSDAECEAAFVPYACFADNPLEAASNAAGVAVTCREYTSEDAAERSILCQILRDIAGAPTGAAEVGPAWRTANVLALARTIYDQNAFERMLILGDALLQAGCDNEEILAQCREPGPHVRGCWVVDLLLGKE